MNASITPQSAGPEAGAPPVIAPKSNGWRRLWWALGGALLVALGLLFTYNPAHHSFYPFCTFHRMTGWQCPGCGGLRSVHHLLHGELITAFRFNPIVVLGAPVAVWLLARRWLCGPSPTRLSFRAQARWGWAVLALLIVFWVVRNLPFEMFRLPSE